MRTASSATLGSRRHRTIVHEDDMSLQEAKVPKHGLGGRRALGDITNAVAGEAPRASRVVKKTNSHTSVASFVDAAPTVYIAGGQVLDQPEMQIAEPTRLPRPYMQREIDDIDDGDCLNPSMATSYVNDMYECLRETEQENMVNPSYMANQPHINMKMRAILVDWLVEAHSKFKMHAETLFLAIWVIDRYLELRQVRRSRLQLVGITALLIAAKYEEIYPPELKELVYITDRAYSKQDILTMEASILSALEFRLTVPTIHTFVCRFVKAAHADTTMIQMTCYLAERCLQEYSMIRFLPSTIAAAVVMISRKSLRRHPWSPTLLHYTGYDEDDLAACVREIESFMNDAASNLTAVRRKYSTSRNGGVAKMPLTF